MKLSKQAIALLLVGVLVVVMYGCTAVAEKSEQETATVPATTESTTTTTTTTTKPTTTEDVGTTFAESSTTQIFKALYKDTTGEYPYELASYTSTYNEYDTSRTENLKAATKQLNDLKIPANESFSFNQTLGKRTVTAGYSTAKVIANDEFVDGLGGGICQVSSTVFQAVLRSNIEILKRTYHTLEIGYVPLGGDATVQWNSKDFQFKNNTGGDIKLKMTCSNGQLTCTVYGKKKVDTSGVKVNISYSNGTYTLTRTVDGKQNYITNSEYKKPTTTTKKETTKKATTTKKN